MPGGLGPERAQGNFRDTITELGKTRSSAVGVFSDFTAERSGTSLKDERIRSVFQQFFEVRAREVLHKQLVVIN